MTQGEGADATLDCTGIPQPRGNTVRSARIYGRACLVGEGGETSFDVSRDIMPKQLAIHGSWTMNTIGLGEVAQYVAERKLPLKKLITYRFRLEQAAEAYKIFESGQTWKTII